MSAEFVIKSSSVIINGVLVKRETHSQFTSDLVELKRGLLVSVISVWSVIRPHRVLHAQTGGVGQAFLKNDVSLEENFLSSLMGRRSHFNIVHFIFIRERDSRRGSGKSLMKSDINYNQIMPQAEVTKTLKTML